MRAAPYFLPCLPLLALTAPAAADTKPASRFSISGEIKEVLASGTQVRFTTVVRKDGKLVETTELLLLAKHCRVTLDGKPATLASLKAGQYVTLRAPTDREPITAALALRPQYLTARKPRVKPGVRVVDHVPIEIVEARERAERYARLKQGARNLEAAYAAYLQQQREESRRRLGLSGSQYGVRASGRMVAPPAGLSGEKMEVALAVMVAFFGDYASKSLMEEDNLLSQALGLVVKRGRDVAIDHALSKAFPDLKEPAVRAIRRVIALALDSELTTSNYKKATAVEEIKEWLKKEDRALGNAAEVAEFIYELARTARK